MTFAEAGDRPDGAPGKRSEEAVSWAIDHADMDTLTATVDSLCHDERFDDVVALRHRCRAAMTRGLQLWPVAAYCDYRLALDAPSALALTGLGEQSERFMFGPLAEILASTHTFASLSSSLPRTPPASAFAHECVVRGEDLSNDEVARALPEVFDLPLALEAWEPSYSLAVYGPDRARFDRPLLAEPTNQVQLTTSRRVSDAAVNETLSDLVKPWVTSSNGRVDIACIEGTAEDAIGALGLSRATTVEIAASDAIAWMAWAAASGGALGRRRGASAGRQQVWWTLRALTGLDDDEPVVGDQLGEAIDELRWLRWNDGSPETGWSLRLAIEDPIDQLAWVISAVDAT